MNIWLKSILPANPNHTKWALLGLFTFAVVIALTIFNIFMFTAFNASPVEATTITEVATNAIQFDMDSYRSTISAFKQGRL